MVLVVGMARSGIAAARLLQSRGHSVFVTDSGKGASTDILEAEGIPYETGGHSDRLFQEAEEIVISPGVPLDIRPLAAALRRGVPVVSEVEIGFRYLQGEIVAITGSNGKTTTTTLIGEILNATGRHVQVGGNIGTAMTSLVETSTPQTVNVVEISSFQLDTIRKFRPRVAVLLNITPDHLDRYADFEAYRRSKFRLFMNQTSSDVAVLNRDDPQVYPLPVEIESRQQLFSQTTEIADGAFRKGNHVFFGESHVMAVREIPLRGSHNVENILASISAASVYAVPLPVIADVIRRFRGVEHRLELVDTINGIDFYNDSKATNVDSSIKAVESFRSNIILILGGKDKGASYMPLVRAMKGRVKHVLLVGAAANKISEALGDLFPKTFVASIEDAVDKALHIGKAGDIVLLSPACASFDMFDNYEHRGRVFKQAVQENKWRES
jgi:UDP-N-acetylmuramoylalanine--D-glutamate ligase